MLHFADLEVIKIIQVYQLQAKTKRGDLLKKFSVYKTILKEQHSVNLNMKELRLFGLYFPQNVMLA